MTGKQLFDWEEIGDFRKKRLRQQGEKQIRYWEHVKKDIHGLDQKTAVSRLIKVMKIDAAQSIDRIIDVFPPSHQRQVRLQLCQVIEAVLSQTLLPRIGGGRIAAFEIMVATSVIRRLIREENVFEIPANTEMSRLEGMQTLDQTLANLVRGGLVTREDTLMKTSNPVKLSELLGIQHEPLSSRQQRRLQH